MRPQVPLFGAVALLAWISTVVLAQPRPGVRPGARPASGPRGDGGAAPAAPVDAGADGAVDVGTTSVDSDAGVVIVGDAAFPMRQVGTGTVIHFPIPEQLQRTGVPVFVQVRSSAPIDHVSLYYRGVGARRYTELRMQAMGQQFRLASGYGALIPCEDVFPPRVEYYVEAYASSGDVNGRAGSAETPVEVPVVERRSHPAPTLPGQSLPRTCGSLTAASTARDAGVPDAAPTRGTADLGEPCRSTNDCRSGLRCGSNNQCVFDRSP